MNADPTPPPGPPDPPDRSRRSAARAITLTVVALLALAVFVLVRPALRGRPSTATAPPPAVPTAAWRSVVDTLERGETITQLLTRAGLSTQGATAIVRAAPSLDARRIPAGMPVSMRFAPNDSLPTEIVLQLAVDRLLHVERTDSGWVGRDERLPWTIDTIVVRGVVRSTLYEAMDSAAAFLPGPTRAELAWTLADVYEYRVDMSRDLQDGDAFRVLVERARGPQGAVRIGQILAATFRLSGTETQAIRHTLAGRGPGYFDQTGKSMRAQFLRAPLEFRRISSVFGLRKHPILGIWRAHTGTDYAAAAGTRVRSIGDGTVIFAGRRGGYGNAIDIRHPNGFVTRYGHLRGFAAGIRRGVHVALGQTIGFVGSTGLATAPHLHFEVIVGGVQRNPRTAIARTGGEPLPTSERAAFERSRFVLLALLDHAEADGSIALHR